MQEIIIDRQFKELLPPLDKETYRALEENIIANGCMFPLVTWGGILIDVYNRYAICTEHEIPFEVVDKEFSSRGDVVVWIIGNQVARRNLTPMQLSYFRGLHYNTVKGKGGNPTGRNQYSEVESENPSQPQETITAKKLAQQYKVHSDTIYTDAKATKAIDAIGEASAEAKAKILSGDVSVDKKELQRLASASDDEINRLAEEIENGTYKKPDTKGQIGAVGATPGQQPPGQQTQLLADSPISAAADRAYKVFSEIAANGTKTQIRNALRALIDELESLYLQS